MTHIFLVAGAPAVGKSTTAHALAARFEKSVHIPVDAVRDMVVSGLVHPSEQWDEKLVEQLTLARESAARMAVTYQRAGFAVVMDDFWDPNSQLREYERFLHEQPIRKILLYPSQQAAHERNRKRAGPGDASDYIAGGIRTVYAHLESNLAQLERQGWRVVDTTGQSVEATVDHILAQNV